MFLKKKLALAAGIVFPFCEWTRAHAQAGRYRGWQMGPEMMYGWGMGWFGGIFSLIFWILIIVGLVFLIRWLIHASKGHPAAQLQNGSRALEILRERYARGEIDKQEFEEKKRDLGY
jgi:putative membrane protein